MSELAPPRADLGSNGDGPVLEVSGLRKEFGDLVAVDGVSFTVPQARSLAIVGESGSGKTTIARMIVGLERPTAGTITACGRDRSSPARSARVRRRRGSEVQIVFQDPYTSLDPRQTAEATIDEVLRLHHGWPRERRRARMDELADLVGLDERAVVRQLTDDAIVLHRGVVVEHGPTAQVLDSPQHAYTKRLRASVPRPGWKPRRGALLGAGEEPATP